MCFKNDVRSRSQQPPSNRMPTTIWNAIPSLANYLISCAPDLSHGRICLGRDPLKIGNGSIRYKSYSFVRLVFARIGLFAKIYLSDRSGTYTAAPADHPASDVYSSNQHLGLEPIPGNNLRIWRRKNQTQQIA